MGKKRSKAKPKKMNIKLRNPLQKLPPITLPNMQNSVLPHVVTILALFPLIIALWVAFPTFELKIKDDVYQFSGVQPYVEVDQTTGESRIYNRLGFTPGGDLQGGVNLRFEIQEPDTSTGTTTTDEESTDTGTGDIAIGKTEEEKQEAVVEDAVGETVRIIRNRLDSLKIEGSELHTLTASGGKTQISIDMTGRRENVGLLPYYLTLTGNEIEVLVDNPDYVVPDENSEEQFNIFEALQSSGLTGDDIAGVQVINDQKTNGPGLRVSFRPDAIAKLQQSAVNLVRFGFVLSVDGQPLGFQSSPYDPNHPDLLYMTDGYGIADIDTFKAVATVINGEKLPLSLNVLKNNNVEPKVNVDLDLFRIALFAAFIVVNAILFVLWRAKSIPVIGLSIYTLVLSVAALKLIRVPLTLNLIEGFVIGLVIIIFIALLASKKLFDQNKISEEQVRENTGKYIHMIMGLSFTILFSMVGLELFSIIHLNQITLGLSAIIIFGLIGSWTVYRVFVNEIFILPNKLTHAKNTK